MLRATPMHSTLDSVGISTDLNKQIQLSSFECQHCRCFGLFWSPVAKWSFRLPNTKVGVRFLSSCTEAGQNSRSFFFVVVVVVVAVAVAVVVVVVPSLTFWMDLNGPNFLMASLVSRWRLGSEAVVGRPWQSWLWRCHQRDEWGWDLIFMGFWEGWNKSLTGCSDGYALKAYKRGAKQTVGHENRVYILVASLEFIPFLYSFGIVPCRCRFCFYQRLAREHFLHLGRRRIQLQSCRRWFLWAEDFSWLCAVCARIPSPFHLDQGTGRWFTPAQFWKA